MSTASKPPKTALIDTDVLIDFLRGNSQAVQCVLALDTGYASSITVAELFAGARGSKEQQALQALLDELTVLPVTHAIAQTAGQMKAQFFPSHGTGLPDALIAATAQCHALPLLTLNVKHFPMSSGLKPAYSKS
jgi:predicted nucleic acid-binding protein